MKIAYFFASSLLLFACGDDDDDTTDTTPQIDGDTEPQIDGDTEPQIDAGVDAGEPAEFTLTSTAFNNGDTLPDQYSCDGDDISPPLAWTAGPKGTKSYAITFIDLDFNDFAHSTIYDIPASVLELPEDIANEYEPSEVAGAKQSLSFDDQTVGYRGPCPGNNVHTYRFTVHAIDIAALPGLDANSTADEAVAAIEAHSLASASLEIESD